MRLRFTALILIILSAIAYASAEIVIIPATVRELGEEEYRDRQDIECVIFEPGSPIKVLPTGVFRDCHNLREVRLPDSLERIGSHAFAYCGALDSISFPRTLQRIGNNAFSRCGSLRKVRVPDSVTELESYAFSDCFALREAQLPDNPSLLGELIFSGCENLELLIEPSEIPPAFDCNSFIFEPDEITLYQNCRLRIPDKSADSYRDAPGWSLFFKKPKLL